MAGYASPTRSRLPAALGAAALELAVIAAVAHGLQTHRGGQVDPPLPPRLTLLPPPPPSPPAHAPVHARAPAGPPARKAPVAAPRAGPAPPLAPASPVPVARGPAGPDAGAAAAGAGSGADGAGAGTGAGGIAVDARHLAGGFSDRDYAHAAGLGLATGAVTVAFRVRADGRVDGCRPVRSSGAAALDRHVCDLIEQRYRFDPARSAGGAPVEQLLQTVVSWGRRGR